MNANRNTDESRPDLAVGSVCPECGHSEMETRWEMCPLPYGHGPDAVQLDVRLPIRKCRKCSFEFLDEESEDLRHEAVCRHLGVSTPRQIKALREKYGFTRADLARLTGLGEATLGRWERGELIQNVGNDSLLWLLQYAENVERLRMRQRAEPAILRKANPNDLRELKDAVERSIFPHASVLKSR